MSCFQLLMERIQQFSIDSEISIDAILKLPHNFIDDYYSGSAWNLKKAHIKKNAQMKEDLWRALSLIK